MSQHGSSRDPTVGDGSRNRHPQSASGDGSEGRRRRSMERLQTPADALAVRQTLPRTTVGSSPLQPRHGEFSSSFSSKLDVTPSSSEVFVASDSARSKRKGNSPSRGARDSSRHSRGSKHDKSGLKRIPSQTLGSAPLASNMLAAALDRPPIHSGSSPSSPVPGVEHESFASMPKSPPQGNRKSNHNSFQCTPNDSLSNIRTGRSSEARGSLRSGSSCETIGGGGVVYIRTDSQHSTSSAPSRGAQVQFNASNASANSKRNTGTESLGAPPPLSTRHLGGEDKPREHTGSSSKDRMRYYVGAENEAYEARRKANRIVSNDQLSTSVSSVTNTNTPQAVLSSMTEDSEDDYYLNRRTMHAKRMEQDGFFSRLKSNFTIPSPSFCTASVSTSTDSRPDSTGVGSFLHQIVGILTSSYINLFLVFVPLVFFSNNVGLNPPLIFLWCFFGLIPLAGILGDLTEDVALHTSDIIASLLNITFGNVTELIISIVALRRSNFAVIKMSLIGSVLANSLFVLGTGAIYGGSYRSTLSLHSAATKTYHGLLFISLAVYAITSSFAWYSQMMTSTGTSTTSYWLTGGMANTPAVTDAPSKGKKSQTSAEPGQQGSNTAYGYDSLVLSRHISVLALVMYFLYLFFQTCTHHSIFKRSSPKPSKAERQRSSSKFGPNRQQSLRTSNSGGFSSQSRVCRSKTQDYGSTNFNYSYSGSGSEEEFAVFDEELEEPKYHVLLDVVGICACAVLISFLSDRLLDTMKSAMDASHLSFGFIGFILIPIVGDVSEHATVLIMMRRGKPDIAIGVALGSAIQIALFVFPAIVLGAWTMSLPVDLVLSPFIIGIFALSVMLVYTCTGEGMMTWLSGTILASLYAMFVIVLLRVPDASP